MTVYKIRHKETGLFYRPSRHRYGKRPDQLHKIGKIYNTKPSTSWICQYIWFDGNKMPVNPDDFEIVELQVTA